MPCVMRSIKKFKTNKKLTSLYNPSLYLHNLKKSITIFLFLTICLSHLNIVETIIDYCNNYNKENAKFSSSLSEEERSEKETKEKDKTDEEKYFPKIHSVLINCFNLTDKEKFFYFSTQLNLHPHQDQELQPPKVV